MSYTIYDSITVENKEGVLEALKELLKTVNGKDNWFFHCDSNVKLIDLLVDDKKIKPMTINIEMETRYGLNIEKVETFFKTIGSFGCHYCRETGFGGDPTCPSFTTVYKDGIPYQQYRTEYYMNDNYEVKELGTEILYLKDKMIFKYKPRLDIDDNLPF